MLYLSHVPFEKIGLPELPRQSSAHVSKKIHRFFTSWLVFPVALYGVFAALIRWNWKEHEDDVARVEAKGLTEQL